MLLRSANQMRVFLAFGQSTISNFALYVISIKTNTLFVFVYSGANLRKNVLCAKLRIALNSREPFAMSARLLRLGKMLLVSESVHCSSDEVRRRGLVLIIIITRT